MVKNIKNILKAAFLFVGSSLLFVSCESDADNLGSQFFEGTAAEGVQKAYDIIAYNKNNNDTVRSDAAKISSSMLGAFDEPQFGMQKASLVSQVRLSSFDPDFGTNPVVDSVVMVLKPAFASDSVSTVTEEAYVFPEGNVPAKRVINTYPVIKYGKTKINTKTVMNINVHLVDDFLGSVNDEVYSNKVVNYSTLLGSKVFNGDVKSIKVTKDSDNSELFTREADIRIPMDSAWFQNNIINKKGQPELLNASNFIRYIKGMRISVAENDGYLMRLNQDQTSIIIYYKRDVTANGTTTPTATTFALNLGSSNAHFSQIEYSRANTPAAAAVAAANSVSGDEKLFLQGMGGPQLRLRIPPATIDSLRSLYNNDKVAIQSAKFRLYSDVESWNNNYEKPSSFTVQEVDPATDKPLNEFLADKAALYGNAVYSLVKTYDLKKNPAYYEIGITQTLKNIVEKNAVNKEFHLTVGGYEINAQTSEPIGQNYTSRAYYPNRIVLVGTDPGNANRAQLNIVYSKK